MASIGKFWEIDAAGFIVNDASQAKILAQHQCTIEVAVEAYLTHLGDTLHSIYVRGTVPRGMAIPGISDLDTLAVVTSGETTGDLDWAAPVEQRIVEEYPDITGVGFERWLITDVLNGNAFPELPFALKTQSVCVHGDDLSSQLAPYRPDASVAQIDLDQIKDDINEASASLRDSYITEDQLQYWCRRIMKNIIRAGFCLTMAAEHKFTRDLGPCVQKFALHYPAQTENMERALRYALDPTGNVADLTAFLNSFGGWIIHEADTWLETHAPST